MDTFACQRLSVLAIRSCQLFAYDFSVSAAHSKKLPISSPFFVIKCVDLPCICKSLNSVRQSFRRPESTNESANERIRVGGDGVTTPKLTAAHSDERGFHFDKLASRFEMKINCQPRASCLNILINFYN